MDPITKRSRKKPTMRVRMPNMNPFFKEGASTLKYHLESNKVKGMASTQNTAYSLNPNTGIPDTICINASTINEKT